jgi:hypothetical protein
MANPILARRQRVLVDTRIALPHNQTGAMEPDSIRWKSSNEAVATVSVDGIVERNMTVNTGTVTIEVSGFFMDYTVPDEQYHREFSGSVTFDLLPLAEVLPILEIPIATRTT